MFHLKIHNFCFKNLPRLRQVQVVQKGTLQKCLARQIGFYQMLKYPGQRYTCFFRSNVNTSLISAFAFKNMHMKPSHNLKVESLGPPGAQKLPNWFSSRLLYFLFGTKLSPSFLIIEGLFSFIQNVIKIIL